MLRRSALVLLALAPLAVGCARLGAKAPRETVEAPAFSAREAARSAAGVAARPGDAAFVGARLRALRLQPLAGRDFLTQRAGLPAAAGYVSGKYPLRSSELVVVAVALGDAPETVGGVLELARVTARVSRFFVAPERTLLFLALPGAPGDPAPLRAFFTVPAWPLDSTAAVVYVGLGADGAARVGEALRPLGVRLVAVPPAPGALATARAAYAALLPVSYGLGAPSDTLSTPADSLRAPADSLGGRVRRPG